MSENKNFHFDQPQIELKQTEKTLSFRDRHIHDTYGAKTEKELLNEQTHLAQVTANNIRSIKNNVQFFFYFIIITVSLGVLIFLIQVS